MKHISYYVVLALVSSVPNAASANIENEYQYRERSGQVAEERCKKLRRLGNYTIQGGGSWDAEYYVDGNSVYAPTQSDTCRYEWEKIATIDVQRNDTYSDIDSGTCTRSLLFKKKNTDLMIFKKSDCFISPTNGVEKSCYVPIDWKQGDRKYPYCGCFDNPIPEWMASSGYCKNATGSNLGGIVNDLFNTLFRKR